MLDKLRQRLAKAAMYSDLYHNEEFQTWKREVVDKRLESYKQEALGSEPESDKHKRALIRYQELKYVTDGVFKVWETMESQLRKEMQKKKEESS